MLIWAPASAGVDTKAVDKARPVRDILSCARSSCQAKVSHGLHLKCGRDVLGHVASGLSEGAPDLLDLRMEPQREELDPVSAQ